MWGKGAADESFVLFAAENLQSSKLASLFSAPCGEKWGIRVTSDLKYLVRVPLRSCSSYIWGSQIQMSTHIASTVCRQHSCSLASAQSRASVASPGPLQLNLSQHQDNVIAVLLQHRGICRCCLAGKQTDTSGTRGTKHGLLLVCLSWSITISDSFFLVGWEICKRSCLYWCFDLAAYVHSCSRPLEHSKLALF